MTITPDKSALAQARERLERHAMFYGYRVEDGKHVEVRTVDYSDLRLVLDALAEAERELKELGELADESRRTRGPLVVRDNVRRWDEDDDCGNPEDWE